MTVITLHKIRQMHQCCEFAIVYTAFDIETESSAGIVSNRLLQ